MADFTRKKIVAGLTADEYIKSYPDNITYFLRESKAFLRIKGNVQTIDDEFITVEIAKGSLLKLKYDQDTEVVDELPDKNISTPFDKTKITFTGKESFLVVVDKNKNLILKGIFRSKK